MKAIMISIKPRYLVKILNGEKTLEIRTKFPKCDLPIDVYIYCSKNQGKKNYLSMVKTDLSSGEIPPRCAVWPPRCAVWPPRYIV